MIVTGIIGGVASGKSTVSAILCGLGAQVLDADRIGHQVLLDNDVKRRIRARWGDRVFGSDGEVHRKRLGEVVFQPNRPEELQDLETIVHPEIGRRLRHEIADLRAGGHCPMVVLDAPVMIKAGWHRECDFVLLVDTPADRRQAFARSRGWPEGEIARREAMQTPLPVQREFATHVLYNHGDLNDLEKQVRAFWNEVTLSNVSSSKHGA